MTIVFLSGVRCAVRRVAGDRTPSDSEFVDAGFAKEQASFHTRVLTSASELGTVEQEWRALHQRSGGAVFQTYEWLATWYRIVEPRLPIRLLTCWDDHKLVGLFPFSIQPINLGIRRVNRVRFACEYGVYGEFTPLVDPDFLEPCTSAAADYLATELAAGRIDFCDFCAFRAESPVMLGLTQALRERKLLVEWDATCMGHVSIDLAATWDEYLTGLKGRQRRELRGDMRALDRPDVKFEVIRDAGRGEALLELLISLHTAAWKRRGAGGHFRTDEYFEQFLRTVTPLLFRQDSATAYTVMHNGKPAVVILNFHSGRNYTAYITGRDLDNALASGSPGKTLWGFCIKDAIERGFTDFDFLGGEQPYKLSLGGSVSYYGRLVARQRGVAGLPGLLAHELLEARHSIQIKFYRHRVLPKVNKIFRDRKHPAVDHP